LPSLRADRLDRPATAPFAAAPPRPPPPPPPVLRPTVTPPGPPGPPAPPVDPLAALVAKATATSAVCWLRYGDDPGDAGDLARSRLAWHVWHEGAALVVSGGTEQALPGIEVADEARVTVRSKDDGGRLVTWVARVEHVRHGSAQWREAAAALAPARLNGRAEDRLLLWAADSAITRLVPTGRVVEHPGERPHGDGAAPPPPSPATTRGALPWVVHRRPRRAPAL
jgi:hypothetical protein